MLKSWLKFFRVVNLPTVPGDVVVGMAAALVANPAGAFSARLLVGASLASCALYLFGLADNDLVGAPTDDRARPIPSGAISPKAAKLARGLCLFASLVFAAAFNLPAAWWAAAVFLVLSILLYNRTKWSLGMGLARGFNVLAGAALAGGRTSFAGWLGKDGGRGIFMSPWETGDFSVLAALVFTAYITWVTAYSRGEENDPGKRRLVGVLVGSLVYLQLAALLVGYLVAPTYPLRTLLLTGAVMLVLLRLVKRALPDVSAS